MLVEAEAATKEAVSQGERGREGEEGVEIEKDDRCQQKEAAKVS